MTRPHLLAALLLTALPLIGAPAVAADPPVQARVDRLEKEMRAVQRKVFPGGSPAFFEPEITPPEAAPAPQGNPASLPINDLSARVSGLERELARITNQLEQDEHRLQILSDAAAKDRAEFDARLKAIEAGPPAAPPAADAGAAPVRPGRSKARPGAKPAEAAPEDAAPSAAAAPATAPPAAPPSARAASGDPAEDAYMAGYQLWADKKYPEAEAALDKVAKTYPKHRRASYARNLAGRAELDDGKPATAAQTFLKNYQADPKGERAPESLFYLGQALTQLKKTDNACRVYDELDSVYGKTMAPALKGRIPAARKAADCKPTAG